MLAKLLSRRSFILASAGVVVLLLVAPASVLAAPGGGHGPNSGTPAASATHGNSSNQGGGASGTSSASPSGGTTTGATNSSSAGGGNGVGSSSPASANGGQPSPSGTDGPPGPSSGSNGSSTSGTQVTTNDANSSRSSGGQSNHTGPGDSNQEDVWVDGYGSPTAPVSAAGPGHEMDPQLGCPTYIILWGSGLADSSGIYTIDGWSPSGSGTGDYNHPGYQQDQAWPFTKSTPGTADWSYSTATGGTQEISYITTAELVAHALANGDTPVNGEGLHFKLQFVQDPQKHKTFWVNCPSPAPPPSTGPDLNLNKTVSATTASFGDTLTYQVTVSNTGTGPASNVTVDDFMGGTAGYTVNMSSFSSVPAVSSFTPGAIGSGEFEWTYASIAAGTSDTMTYTATIDQPATGYVSTQTYLLNNTANITTPACNVAAQCTSTVTTTVPPSTTPPSGPDLNLNKTVSAITASFGDTLTYQVTVSNTGTGPARNVTVDDFMGGTAGYTVNMSSFSSVPAVSSFTPGAIGSGEFEWTYASIAAGTSDTMTYTATIDQPATGYVSTQTYLLSNTANITTPACSVAAQCTSTVTTTVPPSTTPSGPPATAPDLVVAKTVSAARATVGQTLTYTITVSNFGSAPAEDVIMTDSMSGTAGFTVNGNSFSGNPSENVTTVRTGEYTWTYPSIPAGSTYTVTYTATILAPGDTATVVNGDTTITLYNTVTAAPGAGGGCTGTDCTSTVTTTAPLPKGAVKGASTTKPSGSVLAASTTPSTPGTGAHLDLLLTLILVLAGLTLIGFAIATRPRTKPQV